MATPSTTGPEPEQPRHPNLSNEPMAKGVRPTTLRDGGLGFILAMASQNVMPAHHEAPAHRDAVKLRTLDLPNGGRAYVVLEAFQYRRSSEVLAEVLTGLQDRTIDPSRWLFVREGPPPPSLDAPPRGNGGILSVLGARLGVPVVSAVKNINAPETIDLMVDLGADLRPSIDRSLILGWRTHLRATALPETPMNVMAAIDRIARMWSTPVGRELYEGAALLLKSTPKEMAERIRKFEEMVTAIQREDRFAFRLEEPSHVTRVMARDELTVAESMSAVIHHVAGMISTGSYLDLAGAVLDGVKTYGPSVSAPALHRDLVAYLGLGEGLRNLIHPRLCDLRDEASDIATARAISAELDVRPNLEVVVLSGGHLHEKGILAGFSR